jgi:hypothetical protein
MSLLLLPELIQQQLQSPPPSLKLDLFHERRLRVLLAQNDNVRQLHDRQQWICEECLVARLACVKSQKALAANVPVFKN